MKLSQCITAIALLTTIFCSCKETKVTDVHLDKTELTLIAGATHTLVATVLPKDAGDKAVSWASSNTAVADVNNNGTITAKATGTAVITVTTVEGSKTAKCTVTVIALFEDPEMIFVEGGTFMYGCTDEDYNELKDILDLYFEPHYPQKQIALGSFYMAKYPVTQKLWKDVMGTLPALLTKDSAAIGENNPVCYVNMIDVYVFIGKLNRITGKKYRSACSEEWEYAARGGNRSQGYKYSGSNNVDEVAWHSGNSNNSIHPVGEKQPNELGIYDMSGNVWEWTCNSNGLKQPTLYETRGGAWNSGARYCNPSCFVLDLDRGSGDAYTGFRLVIQANEP